MVALLDVLVEDLDFTEGHSPEAPSQRRKLELLTVLFHKQQRPVNFASVLSQALLSSGKFCENYLNNLVEAIDLEFEAQVDVALAVAQTTDAVWSQEGTVHCVIPTAAAFETASIDRSGLFQRETVGV